LPFGEICVMTNRVKTTAARVFMVRHGATVVSAEDRFTGATDVALSDEGREQTQRLAQRLSREKIAAVYAEAGEAIPAVPAGRLSKWWGEHATRANER
jgi:hypothetical protein